MIKASVLAQVVKDLAAERPDETRDCVYFIWDDAGENFNPCCVVGEGMSRLGVDPALFNDDELNISTPVTELQCWDIIEEDSPAAMAYLTAMQGYQDQRKPWGHAHKLAKLKYPKGPSVG